MLELELQMSELQFDEAKHAYTLNGNKVPSVTTILGVLSKPGLDWWGFGCGVNGVAQVLREYDVDPEHPELEKLLRAALKKHSLTPNAVLGDAGRRGTAIHHVFEHFVRHGEYPTVPNALQGYADSLVKFVDKYNPKVIAVEQKIYSPSLKVAGTYDALLEIDGEVVLNDWKTSKRIYDSHLMQVAAYEGMRAEHGLLPRAKTWVTRLDGSGKAPEVVESKATYDDFKAAYELYKARERLK